MTEKKFPDTLPRKFGLKEVRLPPVNGKVLTVGLISPDFEIGGTRRGRQTVPIYDERMQTWIAERAKGLVKKKFDCRIILSGPVRTGKTTNAIGIARRIDPDFPVENIAFRLEEFLEIIQRLPPADPDNGIYPVAIYDESGTGLYNKDFQQKMDKYVTKIYQVNGVKRITTLLCLPHRNLLNKDIRESMMFWVSTNVLDEMRGFAKLRESIYNEWKLDRYWKPLCAYTFDEIKDDFWVEYEKRKIEFVDSFTAEGPPKGDPHRVSEVKGQRDALMRKFARRNVVSLKDLSDATGLGEKAISKIINNP